MHGHARRRLAAAALLAFGVGLASEQVTAAPRPAVVGTDPAGDWSGGAVGPDAPGLDLLKASIGRGPAGTIEFILDVTLLPPPEAYGAFTAYEWYFRVDGREFGFYGPCAGHAYGDCATSTSALAFVVTNFSAQRSEMGTARVVRKEEGGQIVFPVRASFLGATRGAVIAPRPAIAHDSTAAVVAHTAYFVNAGATGAGSPRDVMRVTRSFRVP